MTEQHIDIILARQAYREGKNVTELLRNLYGSCSNEAEIIETAYDLQAGTYIKYANNNSNLLSPYIEEISNILDQELASTDTLLDIGSGELTTLSLILNCLKTPPNKILAFDISWSRIYKGLGYANNILGEKISRLIPFVSEIKKIPLPDQSVDVTISNHALEPNGKNLSELMLELFRVTKKRLILFEPSYEDNTVEGKKRMVALGYIKDIEEITHKLNGTILKKIKIQSAINPLNPTYCFLIKPPTPTNILGNEKKNYDEKIIFSLPGTNFPLVMIDGFFYSPDTGLSFPSLKSIPILRMNASILSSALSDL